MRRTIVIVLSIAAAFFIASTPGMAAQADPEAGQRGNPIEIARLASDPSNTLVRGADSTVTFAPEEGAGETQKTLGIIVCTASVDNTHWSGTTSPSVPNNHGKIDCKATGTPLASIASTTKIYFGNEERGSGFDYRTAATYSESTANAAYCQSGTWHGEVGGYVVAPIGYSPPSANLWARGADIPFFC